MEKIESVTINYIYENEINDTARVGEKFEDSHLDYLHVIDKSNSIIGVYYLDDFCNSDYVIIEKEVPNIQKKISDEQVLLNKILGLSLDELQYIRRDIKKRLGLSFVCCCNSNTIAEAILTILFGSERFMITIVNRVSALKKNEIVLFLSYRKIKLYRKMHSNRIAMFVALNSLVLDSINRKIFYDKYFDLINDFTQMQVKFIYGIIPEQEMLNCLSQESRDRISGFGNVDYEFHARLLGGKESGDYISCFKQKYLSRVVNNGIYKNLEDCRSDFYNVVGGMRVTTNHPNKYEHKIYMFGPCTMRGAMVEDKNTIASILQKQINGNNLPYLVINCGVGGGSDLENTYRYIVSSPICPGDIVILIEEGRFLDENTIDNDNIFYLADGFNKVKLTEEWFLDRPAHCNKKANEVISEQLINKVMEFEHNREIQPDTQMVKLLKGERRIYEDSVQLKMYINHLEKVKFKAKSDDIIGSITMHCNPMTKGHKYLIERALENVDFLYIFILSEDVSDIPFSLRKHILEHEVHEYKNVKILECGKFMASTTTFPEYFSKELNKESRVDASKDILTFCQHVAPVLNITRRFVGTENRDFVTRQYNSQLRIILPMYGIDLFEIERIKNDIGYISAHSTRAFIEKSDWNGVAAMVTEYVLLELKKYYGVV